MKKIKKLVDERQEQELHEIEHYGFWIMYWGLFATIIAQSFVMNIPFKQFAGEWLVFMIGSVVIIVGCVKKGLWDYYSKPSWKNYFLTSVIGTLGISIIFGISKYVQYESLRSHLLDRLLPIVLIFATPIFIMIFICCAVLGKMVLNKQKKMENEFSDK